MTTPIHLHATAELAERVLLPGDPGRALLLAQTLLDGLPLDADCRRRQYWSFPICSSQIERGSTPRPCATPSARWGSWC
ncbi:MAG: hypothetical protein WBP81_07710 [Solirubrobacteraceae bacterium]